jgi:transcriptional regulator with XRE-family HTH domain
MQTKPPQPAATFPWILGDVLAKIRNQQNLRQDELAHAVGVTQTTWSRIENGLSALTVEHLKLASNKLGYPSSQVLQIAEQTEFDLQFKGVEVVPTRGALNLDPTLMLIGAVVLTAAVTYALTKFQK